MGLPMDKFFMNIETTGNTSAASIPVALDEAVRRGELKEGGQGCRDERTESDLKIKSKVERFEWNEQ